MRILVVDDDPALVDLLRRVLTYQGYTVRSASSGAEAFEQLSNYGVDLVVLDLTMPDLDGIEVCRRLREATPDLQILILTGRGRPDDEIAGLEAGADDFVRKPFDHNVLAARISSLLRRRDEISRGGSSEVLRYADLSVDVPGRVAYRGSRRIELTSTEFELLRFLVGNAQHVLSKDLILERVWGYDFGGNYNIVEVYVRALRLKLEAGGEPRLIHTMRGAGYVVRSD
ncbi:MAG: response regulator transcription factor [Dehalococcoidia bacterium]